MSTAFERARAEGLLYFWALTHAGQRWEFIACSWGDGGFYCDEQGIPRRDAKGNTIASHRVEELDPENAAHRQCCEDWYRG